MTYEIGQSYRVPCVKAAKRYSDGRRIETWSGQWIPVLGPIHEDGEIIGFPYPHWHVDWRFASDAVFRRAQGIRQNWAVLAVPIMKHPKKSYELAPDMLERIVLSDTPVLRLRKCKRVSPKWTDIRGVDVHWLKPLEKHCADMKMRNMVCPHRGLPLQGCPQDGDVVHCPGHGLKWNVNTGELVT